MVFYVVGFKGFNLGLERLFKQSGTRVRFGENWGVIPSTRMTAHMGNLHNSISHFGSPHAVHKHT